MGIVTSGAFSHPMNMLGVFSTIGLYACAIYLYRRTNRNSAALAVMALVLTLGTWSLTSLLISTLDVPAVEYVLVLVRPTLLTIFPTIYLVSCQLYVGNNIGNPIRYGVKMYAPFIIPVALIWTHPFHGLYWENVARVTTLGITKYKIYPGPLTMVTYFGVYSYISYALYILYSSFRNRPKKYRRQFIILAGGVVFMGVISVYAIFYPGRVYPNVQMNPHASAVAFVIVFVAMFATDYLRIEPIARSRIVEDVQTAVFTFDSDDVVVDLNEAAEELTGATKQDAKGQPVDYLLPDTDLLTCLDKKVEQTDTVTATIDDVERTFKVQQQPITDQHYGYSGRTMLIDDVTEELADAQRLKRENERMQKFSDAIKRDVESSVLAALDKTQQLKADMESGDLPDSSLTDEITAELSQTEAMIDDILLLTRKGKTVEQRSPLGLNGVVQDAKEEVGVTGHVTVTVDSDTRILGDRERVCIMLEKLFSNAVEHGDATEITVSDVDGGFTVYDNGSGFPDTDNDVLEYGVSTAGKAGIGLAIVKAIAKAHDWNIETGTAPGGGAKVTFTGVKTVESHRPESQPLTTSAD